MNHKIVIRYGLLAAGLLIAISIVSLIVFGTSSDYFEIGTIIGYTSITLSLVFIYFGIKQYRDEHLGGYITFSQALKIGLLIALFPAVAFGFYNVIYTEFIDPQFLDKYYEYELSKMESTMTDSSFIEAKAQIESEKALFMSPIVQFFVMFFTVWIIGFIVSIISSLPLAKKNN